MIYNTEDVFISYSSKDFGVVKRIKEVLEAPPRSVKCWMADEITIASGEDFRSRIVDALRRCKVFLIVLSEASMASQWCSLELSMAILENKKIYSIKIDDSNLSEICSFKLGCSQIADGTINFDAVIESLAVSVKNGRDRILEQGQKRIAEDYKYNAFAYCFWLMAARLIGCAVFGALIFAIWNIFRGGGVLELLRLPADDSRAIQFLTCFEIVLFGGLLWIGIKIPLEVKWRGIISAIQIDSPSALYLVYKVYMEHYLLLRIWVKKKALEYLHRSADLGYKPAIKELVKLYRKGKYVTRDQKVSEEYQTKLSGIAEQ